MQRFRNLLTTGAVLGAVAAIYVALTGGLMAKPPLAAVRSWGYQLQNINLDIDKLVASPADLIVIDYAMSQATGGMRPLTADEVARLKSKPDGSRRIVLSYLSIGEAEEYRFYWKPEWRTTPPAWMIAENCRWPRNHLVRFWEDGWKQIMIRGADSYLSGIVRAGFDGVYLDRIDVYTDIADRHPEARERMIAFVAELASVARQARPGFLVVAQNAEDLLETPAYRALLDGLGKEDLLYGLAGTGVRDRTEDVAWSRERIEKLRREGKTILVAEYLTSADAMTAARRELASMGYVPVLPTRALDGADPLARRPAEPLVKEYGTPEFTVENCNGVWKKA